MRIDPADFLQPMRGEDWQGRAFCRGSAYDPEIWQPENRREARLGISLCRQLCPVRAECLAHAQDHRETSGTWGGVSEWDRRDRRRKVAG